MKLSILWLLKMTFVWFDEKIKNYIARKDLHFYFNVSQQSFSNTKNESFEFIFII